MHRCVLVAPIFHVFLQFGIHFYQLRAVSRIDASVFIERLRFHIFSRFGRCQFEFSCRRLLCFSFPGHLEWETDIGWVWEIEGSFRRTNRLHGRRCSGGGGRRRRWRRQIFAKATGIGTKLSYRYAIDRHELHRTVLCKFGTLNMSIATLRYAMPRRDEKSQIERNRSLLLAFFAAETLVR